MRKFIAFVCVIFFFGCKTEESINNISCGNKVSVQYDRIKSEDKNKSKARKNFEGCAVYFINQYDDEIEAYVNGKLSFDKHIKIDGSSDKLEYFFAFGCPKKSMMPILKVKSKTQNTCFDIQIKKKYKIIYVFLSREGKWIVRFSNIFYLS
jgi:hypothetical protein